MDQLADCAPPSPSLPRRDHSQADANSRQLLTFPTLHINGSLASLASSEAEAAMTRNKPSLQTGSNLDDSAFEVLGDSAILSDVETDDGNTASLTSQSVDGRTPDDLSSLAGTEDDEHYDAVSRREVDDNEHRTEDDLEGSLYSTSDDEDHNLHDRLRSVPRQAQRDVDESEHTVRPESPPIHFDLSPSLPHLRRAPMTNSELFNHHHQRTPRALTIQDLKDWLAALPRELYQDVLYLTEEAVTAARHVGKTVKLTYQANSEAVDAFGKLIAQSLLALLGLFLLAWVSSHLTVTVNTKAPSTQHAASHAVSVTPTPLAQVDPSTKEPVSDAMSASVPAFLSKAPVHDVQTVSVSSDLGAPMQTIPVETTAEFVAHVLGDNHFIITPPKQFLSLKKQPELFVNVIRDGETLPATVSRYEGVYAVEIDRDQAWGVLSVLLYTKSKPKISQQFSLHFGSPWLKLSIWQASAEKLSRGLRDEWSNVNDLFAQTIKFARKEFTARRTQLHSDSDGHADDFVDRATAIQKDISRVISTQTKALGAHLATLQHYVPKNISTGAFAVTKEISKIYSTVTSIDAYGVFREVQEFHAQVAARAQTNAANIVKKIKQKRAHRKEARAERAAVKTQKKHDWGGKKCQKKTTKHEARSSRKLARKQERAARKGLS